MTKFKEIYDRWQIYKIQHRTERRPFHRSDLDGSELSEISLSEEGSQESDLESNGSSVNEPEVDEDEPGVTLMWLRELVLTS